MDTEIFKTKFIYQQIANKKKDENKLLATLTASIFRLIAELKL